MSLSMPKILLIGELILDTTAPVCLPYQTRTVRRRIEPIVYQQLMDNITKLGGVFYPARFLEKFSELIVLFPQPLKGSRNNLAIINDLIANPNNLGIRPVEFDNIEVFEIKRFVEVDDPKNFNENSNWAKGHAFVRLDSGDLKPVYSDKANSVIKELNDILDTNHSDLSCIFLADYDLELFSPEFIDKLGRTIKEKLNNIPIVIYSGKNWSKYSALWDLDRCGLKNCSIITECSEAEDEIRGMDGFIKSEKNKQHLFKFVVSRHPNIRNFVLVDGKRTRIASWIQEKGTSPITVFTADVSTNFITPRTPAGHRALIAAFLSLRLSENKEIINILPLAHEAARYNGAVLIGESIPQMEVNKIRCMELDHDRECGNSPNKTPPFTVLPSEILYQKLLRDNLKLRISEARTDISGYLTFDKEHKDEINACYDDLKHFRLPQCHNDGHIYQKLLIYGPSGCGKSALADLIKKELKDKRAKLKFNSTDDVPIDIKEAKTKIFNYITNWNDQLNWNVYIWDEVGNLGSRTRDLQENIFTYIDRKSNMQGANGVILVTTSFEEDKYSPINLPEGQFPDFYKRLDRRLHVPPLEKRPFDAVYIFSSKLYNKGVREISLEILLAVTNMSFDGTSGLIHWIEDFVDKYVKNDCTKIDYDVFLKIKENLPFQVSEGRYVAILP